MNETSGMNQFLVPGAVVLAGLLIAGAVIYNNSHPSAAGTGGTAPTGTADITKVKTDGEAFIGNANAPVTIAYWSDYQCPFCKQFELSTLPQIIQDYVNAGKVKVVFKDFPFLGQDSITGAEYARSVWKLYPDQFFAWRTAMYNAQDQEGDQGFGDAASIDALDKTVSGLDAAKIAADVKANKAAYDTEMNADRSEGQSQGINATPSFVIGNQLIAGAQDYSVFKQAIEAELNK